LYHFYLNELKGFGGNNADTFYISDTIWLGVAVMKVSHLLPKKLGN
jgi:hypothetical protein